ncbi:hypothetical protein L083_4885 [Actinoplanes sp. N902-109]|nr:hypothetical protein L083_4885 [Actinoplanes sp. N902-109]
MDHPLAILKKMNNDSKHRELPLFVAAVRRSIFYGTSIYGVQLPAGVVRVSAGRDLHDGDEVDGVPYVDGRPAVDTLSAVEFDVDVRAHVPPRGAPVDVVDLLGGLVEFVGHEVVGRFEAIVRAGSSAS